MELAPMLPLHGGSASLQQRAAPIGNPAGSESPRPSVRLSLRGSCFRAGPLRQAHDYTSSCPPQTSIVSQDRTDLLSGPYYPRSVSATAERRSRSSFVCQAVSSPMGSAIEAHALLQKQADLIQDSPEPELLRNEEAEEAFQTPIANIRALLRLWNINNNEADYYDLLGAVDYLQRLGLEAFFRREIKSVLDHVYRLWTERSLSETAALLGDLEVVGLAFFLLRSNEYDVQPSIFELYRKEDGTFSKRPKLGSGHSAAILDVTGLVNLLRASDLRFCSDVVLQDAHKFASTALTNLLNGPERSLHSEKTTAEIQYRLSYWWGINLKLAEMRQTISNFQIESVKFSSGRLSSKVLSLMLSTATQLFNQYVSSFEEEIDEVKRWSIDTGLAAVNMRKPAVLLPFHMGLAYEMPQSKYSHTRKMWGKAYFLMLIQDDLYDVNTAEKNINASMEEIEIFMDAFKKSDPSILEKLPKDEAHVPIRLAWKALHDVTKEWAEMSSAWYGRDLHQTLVDTWMVRLEVYYNEKRWVETDYKFDTKEYLEEYARWSFAAETGNPLAYYSIPGRKFPTSFFHTRPDMEAIFISATAERLLNDARSFEHELTVNEDKQDYIGLLRKENPHMTVENAVEEAEKLAIVYAQKSVEAILKCGIPHREIKQIVLANFRIATRLYWFRDIDGLRDPALDMWLLKPLPTVPENKHSPLGTHLDQNQSTLPELAATVEV